MFYTKLSYGDLDGHPCKRYTPQRNQGIRSTATVASRAVWILMVQEERCVSASSLCEFGRGIPNRNSLEDPWIILRSCSSIHKHVGQ